MVDLANEGLPFGVTLVAANVTAPPTSSSRLKELAHEGRGASSPSCRRTTCTAAPSPRRASGSSKLLGSLREDGIVAAGMIGDRTRTRRS